MLTFRLLWIGRKSKLWIIGIAIPLLAILLCSTITFLWMRRRKKGLLCFVDAGSFLAFDGSKFSTKLMLYLCMLAIQEC